MAEGGEPIWTDAYADVPVRDGYFQVELGSGAVPIEPHMFALHSWLGVQPEGQPEFSPRQPIGDVPTALLARDVLGEIHPSAIWIGAVQVIERGPSLASGLAAS